MAAMFVVNEIFCHLDELSILPTNKAAMKSLCRNSEPWYMVIRSSFSNAEEVMSETRFMKSQKDTFRL